MIYYVIHHHISGRQSIQRVEATCESIARELFVLAYGSNYEIDRVRWLRGDIAK